MPKVRVVLMSMLEVRGAVDGTLTFAAGRVDGGYRVLKPIESGSLTVSRGTGQWRIRPDDPFLTLRRALPIFALFLLSTFATAQQTANQSAAPTAEGPHPAIAASYGRLPLSFEANAGQSDQAAKFMARGNGYVIPSRVGSIIY